MTSWVALITLACAAARLIDRWIYQVVDAKNPFALPSLLTVDPSASSVAKLVLHGRALDVVQAVTREDAAQRKEDGARAREKADKRNTYLMREGGEERAGCTNV